MTKLDIGVLRQRQAMSLNEKINHSRQIIVDWHNYWRGNVYVAFSGGKDSTVLLHLVRSIYPHVPAVFSDTGLEYPEIRDFVKTFDNVTWIKPKMSFKTVVEKYGYPVVSKGNAQKISDIRNTRSPYLLNERLYGDGKGRGNCCKLPEKWKFLIDAPFKISSYCCDALKKRPFHTYEKHTVRKPFIGVLASDSNRRKLNYIARGCNAFMLKHPVSHPLAVWLEHDIWDFIKKMGVPYSTIYDMGCERTGCMFCMFGVHMESHPNRFERMKETHPAQYNYCINKLGCGKVLDFIGVSY